MRAARLECERDTSRARNTIALSGEKQRRVERIEACAIHTNELGYRFRIAPRLVELRAVFRPRRPTIPGSDRIDEHEIGGIEPGARVRLDDPTRAVVSLGARARCNPFGPEADQVHE